MDRTFGSRLLATSVALALALAPTAIPAGAESIEQSAETTPAAEETFGGGSRRRF